MSRCRWSALLLTLVVLVQPVGAAEVGRTLRVAVAANFKPVLDALVARFVDSYAGGAKPQILISSASTGTLYNQIILGAPFDLFLSGDSERAQKLEEKRQILAGSRRTYAYGRLVLWHPGQALTLDSLKDWSGRLAIANPRTAPYGQAARQLLENLALWDSFQSRLVQGSSVQQAWQFVASGAAPVGLLAASLVHDQAVYPVPQSLYSPIRQDLVVLKRGGGQTALAAQLAAFILSGESQAYIASQGYRQGIQP